MLAASPRRRRDREKMPRWRSRPAVPSLTPAAVHAFRNMGRGMMDASRWISGAAVTSNRRRAMGVERLDRLQPPRLTLLALLLRPHDRLPVRRQDQARTGIGHLDAVAAGLVDIEEEGLLDRVLVRAGLDMDAVLKKDVSSG